jgi:hypothetical protein
MLAREDLQRCELVVVPHTFVLSLITFDQHYPVIMPLLLSVLQNAKGSEYHKLRLKAMECAGLIGQFCEPVSIALPKNFGQRSPLAEMCSGKIPASYVNSSCKFRVNLLSTP